MMASSVGVQLLLLMAAASSLLQCVRAVGCTNQTLISDLGDATMPAATGLVFDSLSSGGGQGSPDITTVQISGSPRIVCLATDTVRETYRFASVVVDFSCVGSDCPTSGKSKSCMLANCNYLAIG